MHFNVTVIVLLNTTAPPFTCVYGAASPSTAAPVRHRSKGPKSSHGNKFPEYPRHTDSGIYDSNALYWMRNKGSDAIT